MVRVRVLFPELLSGSPAGKQRALETQRLSPAKTPRPGGTRRLLAAVGQPSAEPAKGSSMEASKAAPKQAKSARGPKASTEPTEVPASKDSVAGVEDVSLSVAAAAPADDAPLAAPAAPVEAPLKRRRSTCEEAQSAACNCDDEVAFSWSALRVTRRDLACLEEGNMLNDAVVEFFLQLMTSQLLPNSDIHLFSTHFYTRLTAAQAANGMIGWENVKGWTKKTSLFSRKLAIVPINAEMHWWLALIRLDVPGPRLFFLDSLEGEDSRYQGVLSFLGGYLQREWTERGAAGIDMDFGSLAFTPETRLKSDEQENGQSLSANATGLPRSLPSR
ncbi:ulp2 [Symbiodinium sp. CCMP2592]|nr:ulp2 [Symbiodinium sp. CCMP2592]